MRRILGKAGLGPLASLLLHRLALMCEGILPSHLLAQPSPKKTGAQNNPINFAYFVASLYPEHIRIQDPEFGFRILNSESGIRNPAS